MKKISKLLSVLMVLLLVLTSAGAAFAETPADKQVGTKTTDEEIPFYKVITKTPVVPYVGYALDDIVYNGKPGLKASLGNLGKGYLTFRVKNTTQRPIRMGIYKDEACTIPAERKLVPADSQWDAITMDITQEAEYWAILYTDDATDLKISQYLYAGIHFYSAEPERSIERNTTNYFAHMNRYQVNYFTWKADYTGEARFRFGVYSWGAYGSATAAVTLCNSKKKALSNTVYMHASNYSSSGISFGVKKGKTYIFKVAQQDLPENSGSMLYAGLRNEKIVQSGGKTMKKAKTLKKKTRRSGVVIIGEKRAYWHKFKIPTKKKMWLYMDGDTNKKMNVTVIYKKGNVTKTQKYTVSRGWVDGFYVKKGHKGWTCYIKIAPADKYSSGWYSLYRRI